MKPYKSWLLFFTLSVIWLISCSKSGAPVVSPPNPEPIDSFAWIDKYCGSYNVQVRYIHPQDTSLIDTTYNATVSVINLREKGYWYNNMFHDDLLYAKVNMLVDTSIINIRLPLYPYLYARNNKPDLALFHELDEDGRITNDSIIITQRIIYNHGYGYQVYIKGIRAK